MIISKGDTVVCHFGLNNTHKLLFTYQFAHGRFSAVSDENGELYMFERHNIKKASDNDKKTICKM